MTTSNVMLLPELNGRTFTFVPLSLMDDQVPPCVEECAFDIVDDGETIELGVIRDAVSIENDRSAGPCHSL